MFLFMRSHIPSILNGTKTQTRRNHKRPRALVGAVHQCRTRMLDKKSCFATIRILRVWQERICDISVRDAQAEGGYSPLSYVEGLLAMHKGRLKVTDTVWCYEFELVTKMRRSESKAAEYTCDGCGYKVFVEAKFFVHEQYDRVVVGTQVECDECGYVMDEDVIK